MLSENQMVIAQTAARKAIESTYNGVCTVYERCNIRDEKSKITRKNSEAVIIENQPCKVVF